MPSTRSKTWMEELEQGIRRCDELIDALRGKVLEITNTICIHDVRHSGVFLYCDQCPLNKYQPMGQHLLLCDLKQKYSNEMS